MKFLSSRTWSHALWPLLLTTVLFPFRLSAGINPHDEGVWLAAVQVLIDGKRLYHDIWFQYGPLLVLPAKALFAFVAPTLSSVRGLFWIENVIGLIGVYGALIKFVKEPRLRLMLSVFIFLVPTASHVPCIPMAARYGIGFFSLWFWPASPLAAGLLAGASFFTSQETGIAVFAAGLFFFTISGAWKRFLAGFAAVLSVGFALIAIFMGLSDYFACVLPGVAALVADQSLALPALAWPFQIQNAADVAAAYVPPILYTALLWQSWKRKNVLLASLTIFGLLMLAPAFGRSDRWHIYIAITPLILCAGVFIDAAFDDKKFLAALCVGALLFLPPFFHQRARDNRLQHNGRISTMERMGRAFIPEGQANGYELLGKWVTANTSAGEPVLFYPYNGAFYFLVDRPNPSRLPILSYATRPEQQQAVVEELKNPALKWVVWDTENREFDGKKVSERLAPIEAAITENFEMKKQAGPFQFWGRK